MLYQLSYASSRRSVIAPRARTARRGAVYVRDPASSTTLGVRPGLTTRDAELPAHEAPDQEIQGAIEDLGYITRRNRVTQEGLGLAEFVVRRLWDRDLHAVQLWFPRCQLINLA